MPTFGATRPERVMHLTRDRAGPVIAHDAAIDARCDVLLTEDLQDGRRFGELTIENPFQEGLAAHEPGRKRFARKTKRPLRERTYSK